MIVITRLCFVSLDLLAIICDHSRAHELMLASVTNTCLVATRSCADGDEFDKDVRDCTTAKTAQGWSSRKQLNLIFYFKSTN